MSQDVVWQKVMRSGIQTDGVGVTARAAIEGRNPRCLWITGLPCAGKSTLAHLLEAALHAKGRHTYLLDGDNVRHGLSRDLGFSAADRDENIRRVAEVMRLLVDVGRVVIVASQKECMRRRDAANYPPSQV
jgi:bifunctional enzyme CysN/CysC